MKSLSKAIFFITLLISSVVFADEQAVQKFPFLGKISQENVNIRAGASQNFEILAKANAGDLIPVIEESYGWYKVRLPLSAHCYVAKDFVEKKDGQSLSKANNLNLRARPNKESSIISQLKKGDAVFIAAEDIDGWYEIFPPKDSYGWVKADFIVYQSEDIAKWEKMNDKRPVVKEVKIKPAPAAQGLVQNMGFTFRKRPGSHKLVSAGKAIYYLISDKCNLKNFESQNVSVWGDVVDMGVDKLLIKVTDIETIEQQQGKPQ